MKILINCFVHINIQSDVCLFYNTLNGCLVRIVNLCFANIVKSSISSEEDNYLFSLADLSSKDVQLLIDSQMGALIDSGKHPIQFMPKTNIDSLSTFLFSKRFDEIVKFDSNLAKKEMEYNSLMGRGVLSYLSILNIHYSSLTDEKYSLYQHVYKQYLYPQVSIASMINLEKIKRFIQDWRYIKRINLIVGDINEKDVVEINNFIHFLKEKHVQIHIYGCIGNENILMKLTSDYLYCWVTSLDDNVCKENAVKNGYTLLGLICSEDDFSMIEELCGEDNIFACNTLQNEKFCTETSGYELNEITQEIISQTQIRTNTNLNLNLFGSLWIYPDNKVYSCPNDKALGTIEKNTVRDVLYKEFTVSKSWFKIRAEYEPCKHCIYNALCPPLTNYELFLGKTLCDQKC